MTCDPKGRDCIERYSSETFHCNATCVGIYADLEWVKKDIDEEIREEKTEITMKADLEKRIEGDLMEIFLLLKNEMKIMKNKMTLMENKIKNDIEEVMNIATGKTGDELDKEKYKRLVSEYRKFKTTNVKHFRFNTAANLSEFGESCLSRDEYE